MKIETSYNMTPAFTQDVFFHCLAQWLRKIKEIASFADVLEEKQQETGAGKETGFRKVAGSGKETGTGMAGTGTAEPQSTAESQSKKNRIGITLEAEHYSMETAGYMHKGLQYTAFRLTNSFNGIWTTDVILVCDAADDEDGSKDGSNGGGGYSGSSGSAAGVAKSGAGHGSRVYVYINSTSETRLTTSTLKNKLEILRILISSGYMPYAAHPFTDRPMDAEDADMLWLSTVAKAGYRDGVPVIMVSPYYNSFAYNVDDYTLATLTAGLAHVVTYSDDYVGQLNSRYHISAPHNGYIAIYHRGKERRRYKGTYKSQGPFEIEILREICGIAKEEMEKDAPTWDSLRNSKVAAESSVKDEMLEDAFSSNTSLEDQLKAEENRNDKLSDENRKLRAQIDHLKEALKSRNDDKSIINASGIPEFFDGELYDMVMSILQREFKSLGDKDTRKYELLESLIDNNPIKGEGIKINDSIRDFFRATRFLSAADWSELKLLGFENVGDSTHFKIQYQGNPKYCFTLGKTPSDCHGGLNMAADIIAKLNVYN